MSTVIDQILVKTQRNQWGFVNQWLFVQ